MTTQLERAKEAVARMELPKPEAQLVHLGNRIADVFIASQLREFAAQAIVRTIGQESGWRPIESAPRDGTPFLTWWGDKIVMTYWLDNSRTITPWQGFRPVGSMIAVSGQPTHWQPLPPPPTTDTEGNDNGN